MSRILSLILLAGFVVVGAGGCPLSLAALRDALDRDTADPNDVVPGDGDVREPIGTADGTLCAGSLLLVDADGDTLVFVVNDDGDFNRWAQRDAVSFDGTTGELVNLTRELRQLATLLGALESETTITDRAAFVGTLRLADNSFWVLSGNDFNVINGWQEFEAVVVIDPPSSGSERDILYLDLCELVRFTPAD